MQFSATQAYMEGNEVAVLQKDQPVRVFDYKNGHLIPTDGKNQALVRRAVAHAAWSSLAYEKSLYRLPAAGEKLQRVAASFAVSGTYLDRRIER